MPLDEAGVDLASPKLRLEHGIEEEAGIGPDRPDLDLVQNGRELADGFGSRSSPRATSLAIIGS